LRPVAVMMQTPPDSRNDTLSSTREQ